MGFTTSSEVSTAEGLAYIRNHSDYVPALDAYKSTFENPKGERCIFYTAPRTPQPRNGAEERSLWWDSNTTCMYRYQMGVWWKIGRSNGFVIKDGDDWC